MRQGPRAGELVTRRSQVHIEKVFPRTTGNRPRFQLGQRHVPQRERTERLEEGAWLVRQREDDRGLVRDRVVKRPTTDDEEARDVVIEVLNRRGERRQPEYLT